MMRLGAPPRDTVFPRGFRLGFLVALVAALAGIGPVFVAAAQPASAAPWVVEPARQVTVTGRGEVVVAPDLAEVSLGVYVRDAELAAAKAAADAAVGRLLALAAALGIPSADVSSTRLSMGPVYSRADTPELLGYEVSRGLEVTLRDLSQLDALVDRAVEAGANRQLHVDLATSREEELRAQALDLAVADATAQARRLAEGFGATLGPIQSVGPPEPGQYVVTGMADSHGTGTFEPGTLEIRAEIQATFRLEG